VNVADPHPSKEASHLPANDSDDHIIVHNDVRLIEIIMCKTQFIVVIADVTEE